MLWNCPHCAQAISPKTLKSVKLENEGGRRALQCPACAQEVEMNVHRSEYWQLAIPAVGLVVLWWASRSGTQSAMILAAVVVGAGFVATLVLKKRVLGSWQRFRAPAGTLRNKT
jgi:hypothetical protein